MLFFCDVKESGDIINAVSGKYVVPERQYDYFFFLETEEEQKVIDHPTKFKVDMNERKIIAKD